MQTYCHFVAAFPATSLPLLMQERERLLMITTSFLTWVYRTVSSLSVAANVPSLLRLLIAFPICLASLSPMAAQAGKDIRGQKPFLLCRYYSVEGDGGKHWKQLGERMFSSTDVLLC